MASITNEVVVKYVDEELRPIAELLQALEVRIGPLLTRHEEQVKPALASHDSGDVVDHRANEGIGSPRKNDINKLELLLTDLHTNLTAATIAELIDLFAVRPVRPPLGA